jgi:hypothetical protein
MAKAAFPSGLVLLTLVSIGHAEDCRGRPAPVEDLANVSGPSLLLIGGQEIDAIVDDCSVVTRPSYGAVLNFAILNHFPKFVEESSGYARVKSIRIFSTSPSDTVKVSRSDGWYLSKQRSQPVAVQKKIRDQPYEGSIEDWNAAHSSPGDPYDLAKKLKLDPPWHAYANSDQTLPSTEQLAYWKVDDTLDRSHVAITNYLLRFNVNTDMNVDSRIPFQVGAQREVTRFDMIIQLSIEGFSSHYAFELR